MRSAGTTDLARRASLASLCAYIGTLMVRPAVTSDPPFARRASQADLHEVGSDTCDPGCNVRLLSTHDGLIVTSIVQVGRTFVDAVVKLHDAVSLPLWKSHSHECLFGRFVGNLNVADFLSQLIAESISNLSEGMRRCSHLVCHFCMRCRIAHDFGGQFSRIFSYSGRVRRRPINRAVNSRLRYNAILERPVVFHEQRESENRPVECEQLDPIFNKLELSSED
mmetsp:Transcript_12159/g.50397  ORF Transcript_12159/g.50397 Transcript_12159/m.50397 type:complete len:223 (-) Transcript_12159:459-1127(-)